MSSSLFSFQKYKIGLIEITEKVENNFRKKPVSSSDEFQSLLFTVKYVVGHLKAILPVLLCGMI